MPGRLDRPGVDVFQILESRKPSALRPVLVPVIVGAHKNIQYNLPLVFHNTQLKATATIGIHAGNTDGATAAAVGDTVTVVDNTAAGAITSIYTYQTAASSGLSVAHGSNMVDSLTNLATQINLGTASSNITAVYDVNSKVVTLTQGVFGTTGNGLAVTVVSAASVMTASTTFTGGRNPETSAVAIPTGIAAVVQQKFPADTDVSVFMETTRGLALLIQTTHYTLARDGNTGVENTVAMEGTLNIDKKLVDSAIADTIILSTEGSTNYIILQDDSVDFSASGVQSGDSISIDFATSVLNATSTVDLIVSSVESSTKLKATFIDNNDDWQNDILVTYDIDIKQLTAVSGQLYVSYKNGLVVNDTNKLIEINGAQDIKDNFGELTPENPLGYHCLMGALATERTYYATRVNEESVSGFEMAFDSLKTVDDAYYVIPASQDNDVQTLAKTHVEFMSDPYQKGERLTLISKVIPDYDIIDDNTVSGGFVTTTLKSVTAGSSVLEATGSLNTIAPGHIVRIEETGVQLADGTYINNETAKLVVLSISGQDITVSGKIHKLNGNVITAGTTSPVSACRITTTSYVGGDKARVAAEKASAIDSQRVTNIFPDIIRASVTRKTQEAPNYPIVTSTLIEDVPGSVAAACIGCHASALKPVQPQSNMVVPGIAGAVGSNDELTADNLDVVAGGGNWILLNQRGGGSVTTRHQLTTAVSDVNTREFSVIKSVDYAAKVFRNYLSPLVGKSIITDSFIKKVVTPTAAAAMYALTDSGQISSKSKVLAIYQNVSDPTRITVEVDILPLYPANYFTVKLFI